MYVTAVLNVMLDVESVVALDTDGTKHAEKCICLIDGG